MDPSMTDQNIRVSQQLATSVYQQVWREFYEWTSDESRRLNRRVSRDFSSLRDALTGASDRTTTPMPQINTANTKWRGVDFEPFDDHPTYDACTAANSNLYGNQSGADESDCLKFLPFADDPKFDAIKYMSKFENLVWTAYEDPDHEMIHLETARRLHVQYNISFEDVDRLRKLPRLRINNEDGLLWRLTQRDHLEWSGYGGTLSLSSWLPDDLLSRFNSFDSSFCANLNCISSHCPAHYALGERSPRETVKPEITNSAIRRIPGTPCGGLCFRLSNNEDQYIDPHAWDDMEQQDVYTILGIMPDALPCNVAVLCRKPCREIWAYRMQRFSDQDIRANKKVARIRRGRKRLSAKVKRLQFPDLQRFTQTDDYTPVLPCSHKGACRDPDALCGCAMKKMYCQRNCQCSSDCQMRWPGCDCTGPRSCVEHRCICVRAGRECDPDVCRSCDARRSRNTNCKNVKILHGDSQAIEITRAEYGVGAFATRSIASEMLIGEYTGEILWRDLHRNDDVPKYLGLNYVFGLNKKYVIDGARAGNSTRYVNHGEDHEANCAAIIRLVNGDHRIALVTTKKVPAGTELLLNYGPAYWGIPNEPADEPNQRVGRIASRD